MRECAKGLRPYHTEVPNASKVDLGKDPVEDVSEQVEAHSRHHCLSTRIAMGAECLKFRGLPSDTPWPELTAYRKRN